jgi:hypothetical protein
MRTSVNALFVCLCLAFATVAQALQCPPYPEQAKKDWQVEVNAAVGKIGPVKGAELSNKTQSVTRDLLSKLPDAGRLYLEQMMFAGYCTALRDDKTMSEADKAKQLQAYNREVRKALSSAPGPAKSKPSPTKPKPEQQSRFDAQFERVTLYPLSEGKVRAEFMIKLVPTTKENSEFATVFLGRAVLHDDDKLTDDIPAANRSPSCKELPSCLAYKVFRWDQPEGGVIVRGAAESIPYTWTMDIPAGVRRVRVNWVFYQREGDDAKCEIDSTKDYTVDAHPYVHSVRAGKKVFDWCYRASGRKVVSIDNK